MATLTTCLVGLAAKATDLVKHILANTGKRWTGLQSIAMIEGERHTDGWVSVERRYFIASQGAAAEPIARAVRANWQVENGCHWVLDMTFREDDNWVRRGRGADTFLTLRYFALNLIKRQAPTLSIRKNRIRADFRQQLLAGEVI